jgi:hypothetical protein
MGSISSSQTMMINLRENMDSIFAKLIRWASRRIARLYAREHPQRHRAVSQGKKASGVPHGFPAPKSNAYNSAASSGRNTVGILSVCHSE